MTELAPWIASAAKGWERRRIRTLGRTGSGSGFPPSLQGQVDLDVPFYKVKYLGQAGAEGVLGTADDTISYETAESLGATVFPAGTLVYAKVGAALMLGRVRVLPVEACIDNNMAGLAPSGDIHPRFLFWTMSQVRFDYLVNPGAVPSLSDRNLLDYPLLIPARDEQRAIADYLDRETACIDTLIEEQQRLIEMLRERRLAAITESVVGASEKNRVLRASAWYPSLPADWGHGRVKSIATRITDGAHISPDTDGGVFDFVSTRDLHAGSIDFGAALKTTPETYEYMVKTGCQPHDGDVLFSKDGTVGETAVIRGEHPFVVASSLVIISPDPLRMESEYLAYVFASKTAKEQAASMMRGAGLPRLSVGNLARVEVPIPPLDEQRRIAAYLDEQTTAVPRSSLGVSWVSVWGDAV